jgi:hypothetical protein
VFTAEDSESVGNKHVINYLNKTGEDKGKGKAIPLLAWTGHECSRRLRLQAFKTIGT